MIKITTSPTIEKLSAVVGYKGTYKLSSVILTVEETDTSLANRLVSGTVSWGNGAADFEFEGSYSGITPQGVSAGITLPSQRYSPGFYQIRISAVNARFPKPDAADYLITLQIDPKTRVEKSPQGVLYGPILPKDDGTPNESQWNLDSGSDLNIIVSSIKMLLITNIGDRIMLPSYGTNLRSLLFEHDITTVETLAREDISFAVNRWEPRASLQSLSIKRDSANKEARIQAVFLSSVHRTQFPVDVTITR